MRQRGLFVAIIFAMSHRQIRFSKPARTSLDLITHLRTRGLTIVDIDEFRNAIERIGYYRLLPYMRSYQNPTTKTFNPGTTSQQILFLYNFDRELRLLCLDAIEKIEVALRAAIVNKLANKYTAHFYVRSRHYQQAQYIKDFVEKTLKPKSAGMNHYYNTYNEPAFPPIWTVLEVISIGTLSQFYSQLHVKNRKIIAKCFGYDERVLVSWFRSISHLRNKCAHHSPIWNLGASNQPATTRSLRTVFGTQQNNIYARVVVLYALVKQVDSNSDWNTGLMNLLTKYPTIMPPSMGFPAGWGRIPFWI